jgi:hypothetical protein
MMKKLLEIGIEVFDWGIMLIFTLIILAGIGTALEIL